MEKSKTEKTWQQWLRFSAFTLAGVAMEGSAPALSAPALSMPAQAAPKAKKWRSMQ